MKINLSLDLDFENWMDNDVEPKTKEDWAEFFTKYLIEYPKSIIGSEPELIALNSFSIQVNDFH